LKVRFGKKWPKNSALPKHKKNSFRCDVAGEGELKGRPPSCWDCLGQFLNRSMSRLQGNVSGSLTAKNF